MVDYHRSSSYSVFRMGVNPNDDIWNLGGRKMIKANKGKAEISGSLAEILSDLAGVINAIHEAAAERLGKEAADVLIASAGRIAFASEEEIKEQADKLNTILEGVMRK